MNSCFAWTVLSCICIILAGCARQGSITTGTKPSAAASSGEKEMRSGIIMYDGCTFGLTPPQGWVLDTESGSSNGVPVVFYPENSSWKDAKGVMYATATAKGEGQTGESMIEFDVNRFRSEDSRVVIKDLPPQTIGRKQAVVKSFFGTSPENYEAVAYIDEEEHVIFLVLSARNMEVFESSLPFFVELVGSYFYMGKN